MADVSAVALFRGSGQRVIAGKRASRWAADKLQARIETMKVREGKFDINEMS